MFSDTLQFYTVLTNTKTDFMAHILNEFYY